MQLFDPEMTDSSSQSDDTSGCGGTTTTRTSRGRSATNSRRRKGQLNAKERNLRRLESNERERMRMHSLNDAYEVRTPGIWQLKLITQLIGLIIIIDDLTKFLTSLTVCRSPIRLRVVLHLSVSHLICQQTLKLTNICSATKFFIHNSFH